jgi:hypothetical protein
MKIPVHILATGEMRLCAVLAIERREGVMCAHIIGIEGLARLDLTHPERGWTV